MKILIVTLEYPPDVGGIASYTLNVASHLPSQQVVVYAPRVALHAQTDARYPWKTYRHKPYWRLWPQWVPLLWQLRKIIKTEHITQLHIHHALPAGYVARILKKVLHIPYTVFLHGSDWQLAAQHRFKLRKLAWVLRGAQQVIVNSEFAKRSVATLVPYLPQIVIVYPCPHDSFFEPQYTAHDIEQLRHELALGGKKVLLTVSRMVDRKGYMRLAECLPKIVEQIPNLVWLIVGDGPELPAVLSSIQKNNLQGLVRLIPSQPPEMVGRFYQLADIFALLTHTDVDGVNEAWGTIFIEAAAAGLPVVAGDSGGVNEAVVNLQTGLVVDATNQTAVINSIVSLLQNPTYAKQMGTAGKVRAQQFKWAQQMSKLNSGH